MNNPGASNFLEEGESSNKAVTNWSSVRMRIKVYKKIWIPNSRFLSV